MNQPVSLEALAAAQAAPAAPVPTNIAPTPAPGQPVMSPAQTAYLTALASGNMPPDQLEFLRQLAAGSVGQGIVNPPEATAPVVAASISVPPPGAPAPTTSPTPIGGAPVKGPSKAEIITQLKAAGIPHKSSQSKDDLAALLAGAALVPPGGSVPVPFSGPYVPVDSATMAQSRAAEAAHTLAEGVAESNPKFLFFQALETLKIAASECDLVVDVTIRNL